MGDLAKGMVHYQRSLAAWRHTGSTVYAAHVQNCIGLVHYYTGEYAKALPILEDALAEVRQGGYLRVEAFVLGSLGDVQRDSGNPQTALEYYETALDIAQRVEEMPLVNCLLDAMANAHRLLGDYATAERLLRQAIEQAEENQSPFELATYTISAGVLAEEQGDLERSGELLREALDQLSDSGARRDMARGRFHFARTLFALGHREKAAHELEICLELCRQLGYDAFMVSEGQRAGDLLNWAQSKGIGGRRLQLVYERLRGPLPPAPSNQRPKIRVEPTGPNRIEVYAFGAARVLVDSRLVTTGDWAVERTKELFFYLLEQQHSLRKEQIVDDVWPDVDLGKSNSQFHSTMYRLRRALFPQCVTYRDGRYQLTLGNC
ncbi:MAG TPA: tetratricopeptide repeat protein, partial [Chloroflexota bacterium]|nr:tetratricopeptide repeat protein [Chloroflexota bacterium]